MKTLIIILAIIITDLTFGQELTMTSTGTQTVSIVEIPNKSQSELFNSTLDWINKTYKNPNHVIVGTSENQYIRFNGSNGTDTYSILIDFKDGKYRLELLDYQFHSGSISMSGIIVNKNVLNKKGDVSWNYGGYKTPIKNINALNKSLENFINTNNQTKW